MSLIGKSNCSKPTHNIIFDFIVCSLCKKGFLNSKEINLSENFEATADLEPFLANSKWWGGNIYTALEHCVLYISTINMQIKVLDYSIFVKTSNTSEEWSCQ